MDEAKFLEFHALASQRKMDLAMRGLPVPNFSIDELFEEAEKVRSWHPRFSSIPQPRTPS